MHTKIKSKPRKKKYEVTFSLGELQSSDNLDIKLVGTFNKWSVSPDDEAFTFKKYRKKFTQLTLELDPGEYEYKYYNTVERKYLDKDEVPEIYSLEEECFTSNEFGGTNCKLHLADF